MNSTADEFLCKESELISLATDVKAVDCLSTEAVVSNVVTRVALMQLLLSKWMLVLSIEQALGPEFLPAQVFITVYLKLSNIQSEFLDAHESVNLKSRTTMGQKESISILAIGKLGVVSPSETIEEMQKRSPKIKVNNIDALMY